ncbi:pumilio 10 [Arabidopsis thaliana]|uniref:Putative pumilio homolog 10 n=1 Tax=Arabidopsis thaliana TaxID=3702 RepID=PUM10_ARATH|nr:pumilio 10 [Arabidopsis thaliana]Q9LP21.2 RecName: Full=Putative pumilio homolog 10; Short=APUM-10; Short=AtPUM10 [Arabidopsis thaliana]AEE31827.1 pumilio 10 [Arabidopsis thaliana]|eukprot:NP_174813.1 pumilio 10 [Arabidopsis thaliana]
MEIFNFGQASDHRRLPDFGSGGFLQSLDTNPFLKNQYYNNSVEALELCKKLNKMGISCDMSIWTKPEEPFRVDPGDFGAKTLHESFGFDQNLTGASQIHDGFRNFSSVRVQNNNFHGVSPSPGLLGLQDSFNPNGFEEMMAFKDHKDFLLDHINEPIKRSPFLRGNDAFKGSLMFEGIRVSQILAAMEGSGASYPDEPKINGGLPLDLVSMVEIYGSVNLMARDQIGCRALQKLVEEGTVLDSKVIFLEIIDHVVELSMDPLGNYIVQKLLVVSDEEQRTMIVSVLTSKPRELIKICLNTNGTRVIQKMIKTVKTKQQIALVKSALEPGFLVLVNDSNGYHVLQSCLEFLVPNDNKFVVEAATEYCAQLATHQYGCYVLQCSLINTVGLQHERLVAEISRDSLRLSQDPFGNYVVQCLIDQQVSSVNLLLPFRTHCIELATQKFSSHVIEKCLRKYPESRAEIVRELLSYPNFEQLLQDPYANYVIQTALSVTKGAVRARLVEKVKRFGKLQSNPYCKKIFSKTILKK